MCVIEHHQLYYTNMTLRRDMIQIILIIIASHEDGMNDIHNDNSVHVMR